MRWSRTPDLRLACSDKKNKHMQGRDNRLFQPGDVQAAIILRTVMMFASRRLRTHQCVRREFEYARTQTRSLSHTHDKSRVTLGCFSPFMHQVCLPMQSGTDGRVGGWVLPV